MKRLLTLLLVLCLTVGCMAGCGGDTAEKDSSADTQPASTAAQTGEASGESVDYAGTVQLDMNSETAKEEVTVKLFIDGDTTHFYVPSSIMPGGVMKGRYLAINTPESTGKIEEYGKKAANFTKEKLSTATSIIIESDTPTWDADSTGDRYLVWVWYKPEGSETYRNLNIEILQNGLAIASNSANNRYGDICMKAIDQAKREKLNAQSGQKDPDFYYGEAVELTLKELRSNIESYTGLKVAFNGVVTVSDTNSVYVESYDAETDMYYGIYVYYGYNLNGDGLAILEVGNEVRIVGSLQYYEAGGTYQISDLNYRTMKPNDPGNIQKIGEGKEGAFPLTTADTFLNGQVTITDDEGNSKEAPYAAMALNSTISMQGLRVVDSYTTSKEDSASKGAFTLTCQVDGKTVSVRTTVLHDANGDLVKAETYEGKTINVRGIVDYYNGGYQIKVFSVDDIEIQ